MAKLKKFRVRWKVVVDNWGNTADETYCVLASSKEEVAQRFRDPDDCVSKVSILTAAEVEKEILQQLKNFKKATFLTPAELDKMGWVKEA